MIVIKDTSVSVDNPLSTKFKVYPNPNETSVFIIEFTEFMESDVEFVLYDNLGKVVYNEVFTSHNKLSRKELSIPNNNKGIYYLKVTVGEKSVIKELVVY